MGTSSTSEAMLFDCSFISVPLGEGGATKMLPSKVIECDSLWWLHCWKSSKPTQQ